jgi:hypothetical protein
MPGDDLTKQASAYLRMLLLRPGEYRKKWERAAVQVEPETIDYDAVARVLASPHDISPDAAVTDEQIAAARAALDGTALGAETLSRFIDAFTVNTRHAARLQGLLRGSAAVRVITGDVQLSPELGVLDAPPQHETLSLHELHILGPDGAPAEHQTIQVIKSTVDRLVSYPYRFDTDELAVEVIRGGSVGDRIYRIGAELYGVDVVLAKPLAMGETTLMQVHTTFFYKTPPAPEFRRGVLRTTKDVTIWVKFHPDRVPARVWSARWDRVDHARVVAREPVELDDELSVHLRYDAIERAIVGFTWDWPQPRR